MSKRGFIVGMSKRVVVRGGPLSHHVTTRPSGVRRIVVERVRSMVAEKEPDWNRQAIATKLPPTSRTEPRQSISKTYRIDQTQETPSQLRFSPSITAKAMPRFSKKRARDEEDASDDGDAGPASAPAKKVKSKETKSKETKPKEAKPKEPAALGSGVDDEGNPYWEVIRVRAQVSPHGSQARPRLTALDIAGRFLQNVALASPSSTKWSSSASASTTTRVAS